MQACKGSKVFSPCCTLESLELLTVPKSMYACANLETEDVEMKIEHLIQQLNEINKVNFSDAEKFKNWDDLKRFLNSIDLDNEVFFAAIFENKLDVTRCIQKNLAKRLQKALEEQEKEALTTFYNARRTLLSTQLKTTNAIGESLV